MSNLGQAALIVVGTVVGAYFGNPQLGFALGALAGSELFPTQLPSGPKLTDNRTTTANVGDPIPIVFGTATIGGTVIWLAPYVQHTNKSGKGGPSQTTYSYTQSIAIGLSEAVIDGGTALAGLSRVWENGTIVYDIRPQQGADSATGAPAETDVQYANRLAVSAAYAETFTLYLGDEEQTADPTIEAVLGFGNVPGWRGRAYIVYPNRNLQLAQGWRHPNFTFEVFQSGTGECTNETKYSAGVVYPWPNDGGPNPLNVNSFRIMLADPAAPHFDSTPITFNFLYGSLEAALAVTDAMYDAPYDTLITYALNNGGGLSVTSMVGGGAAIGGNGGITIAGQYLNPDPSEVQLFFGNSAPGDGIFNALVSPSHAVMNTPGAKWDMGGRMFLNTGVSTSSTPPALLFPWCTVAGFGSGYPYFAQGATNVVINVHREPGPPLAPCTGLPRWSVDATYGVQTDGLLVKCNPWVMGTAANYWSLQLPSIKTGGQQDNYTVVYPLDPTLPQFDPRNTSAFWTAAYNAAVANGSMAAGKSYPGDYPVLQSIAAYQLDLTTCTGTSGQAKVADIITALCARAGVANIDVSDLVAQDCEVSGYSISALSNATNCIQPLRSIAFFDAVESNAILRFQTRGKPIVATLSTDDIGCFDGGQSSNVPPSVTVARVDETTLPRSIRLHYKSVNRDYQDAEQPSPFRLTTKAINDQDVSVPFCMGDTQALKCAEILWSDAWAGKNTYTLSIDQSLSEIEVGDAVGIPVDGTMQRARIISEQNSSGVLRKLSLMSDNEGAYISFAIAEAPQVQPQRLTLLAGTALELLDLPALQDADSDPGFYLAAQRIGAGNTWKGCVIYKSIDGGSTWASMFSMVMESTAGTLHATPPASEYFTWDALTEVTVDLNSTDFSLESRTDDAVLAGANAAAIGADGRWEIVQFANAVKLSPTQWRLTRLLRGRRGTEHHIGKSVAGDAFVLLTAGDLARLILSSSEIGALHSYDAPSIGATFSSGTVYPFAGHAMALTPFAPVDAHAVLESDGDILIRWTRRDRLGRTLMSGVDMPLSEATLAFQLDILNSDSPDSPISSIRTLTTATTHVTYTAAQQFADFGSSAPTQLGIAIYQMSAVVGRGIPLVTTITIGTSP